MQPQNFQPSQHHQPQPSSQAPPSPSPPPPYPGTTYHSYYATSSAGMPYAEFYSSGPYPKQQPVPNVPGQFGYGRTVIIREQQPRNDFVDKCFLLACCYALLCCCCSPFGSSY